MSRKLIFCVVAFCLFSIVALSLTASVDGNHECTGDNCVMCLATTVREQILNVMVVLFFAVSAFVLPVFAFLQKREEICFSTVACTPVNLKVKLSD